jgi:hypothetical protein
MDRMGYTEHEQELNSFAQQNFPKPPPLPDVPQASKSDLRRKMILEISNELEAIENEFDAYKRNISTSFDLAWREAFGEGCFELDRKHIRIRMGL